MGSIRAWFRAIRGWQQGVTVGFFVAVASACEEFLSRSTFADAAIPSAWHAAIILPIFAMMWHLSSKSKLPRAR